MKIISEKKKKKNVQNNYKNKNMSEKILKIKIYPQKL